MGIVDSALQPVRITDKAQLNHRKAHLEHKRNESSRVARLARCEAWNLHRLGLPELVIQRILRHANVSTTATYYIKTAADDVRNAMAVLENYIEGLNPSNSALSLRLELEQVSPDRPRLNS